MAIRVLAFFSVRDRLFPLLYLFYALYFPYLAPHPACTHLVSRAYVNVPLLQTPLGFSLPTVVSSSGQPSSLVPPSTPPPLSITPFCEGLYTVAEPDNASCQDCDVPDCPDKGHQDLASTTNLTCGPHLTTAQKADSFQTVATKRLINVVDV
ncbi:unnamed protein product [Protopolystoma xenopodis]|uniref:Uncharacterized protein n=1 Tax=Protopolystoma xenopodis TaxID=117903 RepID=A0A448WTX4_9PLAT|nr:unnamed protein product [Protopolystoma xenopodis]